MCKAGGPRCPMDHRRRSEVNARRRTRDRATRAYRAGLVAALKDQGQDELAQVARKAPSGDLAVMAAATGNTAVGDGLDYVPGMKRANEKVSADVVSALGDAGVSVDGDNRGDMLADVTAEKPGTPEKLDTEGTSAGDDVYVNIDTPEKARAAADAMYVELEHLDRDELAAMDRDELEALYNKYNAIDDAIRAQGDIGADETSGNAFVNLHDVYHGLDEDGLNPETDYDDGEGTGAVGLHHDGDGGQVPGTSGHAAGPGHAGGDDLDEAFEEFVAIDEALRAQNDADKAGEAGTVKSVEEAGGTGAETATARGENLQDDVEAMFTNVNTDPDVDTKDKANHAAAVAHHMATAQDPAGYSDDELAVKMENLNWIGDGVHAYASDGAKREFNEAHALFASEVAQREEAAVNEVATHAALLSERDPGEFHDAMERLGLEESVRLNDDGTIEYGDASPLGKLKVANEVRSYAQSRQERGADTPSFDLNNVSATPITSDNIGALEGQVRG